MLQIKEYEVTIWLNGRIEHRRFLTDEKRAICIGKYPNGSIEYKHDMYNGEYHGLSEMWHRNGVLSRRFTYVHGRLHGVKTSWYENGHKQFEGNYDNGERVGCHKFYTRDGLVREERVYIRGVGLPQRLAGMLTRGLMRAEHIVEISNAEIRRVCLEELGYSRFLSQIDHEIVDKNGDEELVVINWHPDEEPLCLVKIKCPSTCVFYTLRVPPEMKSVKEAIAWTFGISEERYKPVVET